MKIIETRNEMNTLGTCTNEWAVFNLSEYEYYGFDYSNEAVILVNYDGKFIIGKKYSNCISIDSGFIREFDTFAEAKENVESVCARL